MTWPPGSLDALRRAFVAGGESSATGSACPTAAEIWEASHAEVRPARAHDVARHVATCAACAADWHLALHSESRPAVAEPARPRPSAGGRWAGLAAAAAVLAGVAWLGLEGLGERETSPAFREAPGSATIRSLVPEDHPLPRDGAVLRWSTAGEGARYTVELSSQDLTPLHTQHALAVTEFSVPRDVIERLGTAPTLVWRVEARLPDGRRVRSGAFIHRIE